MQLEQHAPRIVQRGKNGAEMNQRDGDGGTPFDSNSLRLNRRRRGGWQRLRFRGWPAKKGHSNSAGSWRGLRLAWRAEHCRGRTAAAMKKLRPRHHRRPRPSPRPHPRERARWCGRVKQTFYVTAVRQRGLVATDPRKVFKRPTLVGTRMTLNGRTQREQVRARRQRPQTPPLQESCVWAPRRLSPLRSTASRRPAAAPSGRRAVRRCPLAKKVVGTTAPALFPVVKLFAGPLAISASPKCILHNITILY